MQEMSDILASRVLLITKQINVIVAIVAHDADSIWFSTSESGLCKKRKSV